MPTEIRRLLFSNEELCGVLSTFINSTKTHVEPGTVVAFEVAKTDPILLKCRMVSQNGRQTGEALEGVFVCAAILSWCMKNKIPLARKAKKVVHVTQDGRIALDVTLSS
jgi:hypothetical protein